MDFGPPLDGETPIDDISGLKIKGIKTRSALNNAEAENIRRVVVKYLAAKPSRSAAKFDLNWSVKLHRQMFGQVWSWAGVIRNIWLKRHDHPIVRWPEETMGAQSVVRKKYLSAIRAADVGEYEQLTKLHRRYALPGKQDGPGVGRR